MSVETFDPKSSSPEMTPGRLSRLLEAAGRLDADGFGLSPREKDELAPLVRHGDIDWRELAADLSDAEIESLIRLFTLGEGKFPAWESGPRSPVIPLVAELKRRGSFAQTLTSWIKAHSDNRFLPYGSLLDRL